jgi:hypothetical protein
MNLSINRIRCSWIPALLVGALLITLSAAASGDLEKKLAKGADKLSYEGQLETAREMMGQEPAKNGDGGWDGTSLVLSMLWGSIGTGYFIYGKKQSRLVFLLCGIGLCVFPMIISGNGWSVILGVSMTLAPFKIDF